jgi:FAD/FMN-containing dehydrogenase
LFQVQKWNVASRKATLFELSLEALQSFEVGMAATQSSVPVNWDRLILEFGSIETIRDPNQLEKLSKDYYHFSPVLQEQLKDKVADLVVRPANETEVLQVAKVCVAAQVPLTVRGSGTGNYGQCIPLDGGVVLDLSKMNAVKWVKPGVACVEPGAKLSAIDKVTQETGWEIRMYPSTYRTATIGGFIGGGSGGIGSITYGQLRDRGNLNAVRVVTLEDDPRVIELRGDEVQQVNHAYGTNGIITELEIPLGPAYPWAEVIVVFDDFMAAARFGQSLGEADGLVKKLISVHAWPIPGYFAALKPYLPKGKAAALLIIAEPSLELFGELVKEFGGIITYSTARSGTGRIAPLAEFTWNHTTLHARSVDPTLTYLQTLFPYDPDLTLVQHFDQYFGDEVLMHLEFLRLGGNVCPAALQIVRYTTAERLCEIISYHEKNGAFIANPPRCLAFFSFFNHFLSHVRGAGGIVRELHRKLAATRGHGAQVANVAKHFAQRSIGLDAHPGRSGFLGLDDAATTVEVTDDIAHVVFGGEDVHLHDRLQELGLGLGHRLPIGGPGGNFEGDGARVYRVVGPVGQGHLQINHREARQRPLVNAGFKALLHRRPEFPRHVTAGHLRLKEEAFARFSRLDDIVDLAVLTRTTRLLLVGVAVFQALGDGFAVGHLGLTYFYFDTVGALEDVHLNVKVEFAHPLQDDFTTFLIGFHLEGGIFLHHLADGHAHLLVVAFLLGIDRNGNHRVGEDHGFQGGGSLGSQRV